MTDVPNIRSHIVGLLMAHTRCPGCARSTVVFALTFPCGHEERDEEVECADPGWYPNPVTLVVQTVRSVSGPALQSIEAWAPLLHPDERSGPWINHCEHCGGSLDDASLHTEPGAAFVPTGLEQAAALRHRMIDAACSAVVEAVSLDPPWFESFEQV